MLERGGVDWSKSRFLPAHTQVDGYRIAKAQWLKLGGEKALGPFLPLAHQIAGRVGVDVRVLTDREWITVMNHLGKLIRARKAVV
jgi:hypothetical protein